MLELNSFNKSKAPLLTCIRLWHLNEFEVDIYMDGREKKTKKKTITKVMQIKVLSQQQYE